MNKGDNMFNKFNFKSRKLKMTALSITMCFIFSSCGLQEPDMQKIDLGKNPANDNIVTKAKVSRKKSDKNSNIKKEDDNRSKTGVSSCTLLCVGDNLIHDNIYKEALKKGNNQTYDFTDCYKHIEKYIDADINIINQETLVNDYSEPKSYPVFSTPTALGDKVCDLGFNVVSMCNNHVLDCGSAGLINSLDYWDTKNVVHYGAYRDEADSENIRTLEVNGIKFAFLGYMEHTNYITLNEGEPGKVIYLSQEDVIQRQIEKADKMADVVVVSCHYGTEISNELNQQQTEITPKLVSWGADLIIGTQAHAMSKSEYLDKPDGTKAFVFYGLGNFFSTMYEPNSLIGKMGKLKIEKNNADGKVNIKDVKEIPVISHFEADNYDSDWYNCAVYPYSEYTDELYSKNFVEGFTREYTEQILKDYLTFGDMNN